MTTTILLRRTKKDRILNHVLFALLCATLLMASSPPGGEQRNQFHCDERYRTAGMVEEERSDLVEDEFRILLIQGRQARAYAVQSRELQLGRFGAGKRGGWGYVRYRTGGRSDYGEYLV